MISLIDWRHWPGRSIQSGLCCYRRFRLLYCFSDGSTFWRGGYRSNSSGWVWYALSLESNRWIFMSDWNLIYSFKDSPKNYCPCTPSIWYWDTILRATFDPPHISHDQYPPLGGASPRIGAYHLLPSDGAKSQPFHPSKRLIMLQLKTSPPETLHVLDHMQQQINHALPQPWPPNNGARIVGMLIRVQRRRRYETCHELKE